MSTTLGKLDNVKKLFPKYTKGCDNFLMQSVIHGHLDLVEYFVGIGCKYRFGDDILLMKAVEHGHIEIVKYLTSIGCNPKACNHKALDLSIRNRHKKITEYLIEQGCSLKVDDIRKYFELGVTDGCVGIIEYCVSHHGRHNFTINRSNALKLCIEFGHFETVKTLLSAGWYVGEFSFPFKNTRREHLEIAKYFFDLGFFTEKRIEVLIWCIENNHFDMVSELINSGYGFTVNSEKFKKNFLKNRYTFNFAIETNCIKAAKYFMDLACEVTLDQYIVLLGRVYTRYFRTRTNIDFRKNENFHLMLISRLNKRELTKGPKNSEYINLLSDYDRAKFFEIARPILQRKILFFKSFCKNNLFKQILKPKSLAMQMILIE
jgi:hypothetical protein